ncbi:linear amide C-N hydrolase [Photobacterium gaetbulicola]|uniref:Choloylglycine hydrolase/NAAA C-terminal domain-containing protein n=1 Tax=Photobacterium gaetbulicola Gung47 TaxID=658445 RepID=A0A0C5WDF9_9GAMM|nr:linear amide C-N hydrolase [Photobacterium gaetbulicola]AJR05138.1 hypothetical protein H744_1c0109 [Photobacterium gaetbulicola Gung47]PSU06837.1 linear amide C-N hydrolase [Photobacterium gaetbulicola]
MCSSLGVMSAGQSVLGVNYDFQFDHGMVVINPRRLQKWSELPQGGVFRWQSLYGSATLVQFGCELPSGGINESGLSLHLLEQRDAAYPPLAATDTVLGELQWIQYQLDVSQSVDDVVASLDTVKVHSQFIPLHYVVADSFGQGAVIEFVRGQVEVTRFREGQPLVLTNHSLSSSRQHDQSQASRTDDNSSFSRYCRLSTYSLSYCNGVEPESFVSIGLDRVAIAGRFWDPMLHLFRGASSFRTCWQVLFLPATKEMKFRRYENGKGFNLSLERWDFSALDKRLSSDFSCLQTGGDKLEFSPYSLKDNRRIVTKTYRPYRRHFPAQAVEDIARYPDEFMLSAE